MSGYERVDDEAVAESIAWSPPDVPTDTCRACGANLSAKSPAWYEVSPAGGFCAYHLRDR